MKTITTEKLAEMVAEALERTCFMVTDPTDQESVAEQNYALTHCARIAYAGPASGYIYVVASDGFLEELASSLLGCEPEEINLNNEGRDAVKELANILGGSVTMELGGQESEYRLGLPEESDGIESASGTECYIESTYGALRVLWYPVDNESSNAA